MAGWLAANTNNPFSSVGAQNMQVVGRTANTPTVSGHLSGLESKLKSNFLVVVAVVVVVFIDMIVAVVVVVVVELLLFFLLFGT